MKRSLVQLIGTAAVVAMLGLPVALSAANRPNASTSVDVSGVVRPVTMKNAKEGAQSILGIVDSQGEVLVLRSDAAAPAAFQKVTKAAGKEDYVRVRGIRTSYEGMPAIRVQKVSVE